MKTEDWTSLQWAEYYDKQSRKNYMAFQETGMPRYDKVAYRYELIAGAFRAKHAQDNETAVDMKKRMTNRDYVIARLIPGKMYSREEVVKLLQDAVWW